MALFTDGQINRIEDLQRYENSILNVASIEQLNVAAKMALAQEEVEQQILLFLLRHPLRDTRATVRRSLGLSDVVVTNALQRWHALKALALIYRDAYNNQLNDRYSGKWQEYEQLSQSAATDYLQAGVGLVADPVPKADSPVLATVSGEGESGTYYAAATWLNGAGQEGAASEVVVSTTLPGTQLGVSSVNPPANAVGWNVYVGATPDSLALQNDSAIAVNGQWFLPATGVVAGASPSVGQKPEWFLVDDRLLQRG